MPIENQAPAQSLGRYQQGEEKNNYYICTLKHNENETSKSNQNI